MTRERAGVERRGFDAACGVPALETGPTAVHRAENHTPKICMKAAGDTLDSIASREWFELNGL
jgi:hypothetical protein